MPGIKQKEIFPQLAKDNPWTNTTEYKRHYLSFPCYPFRTLCPRDLYSFPSNSQEFDSASPIFPANTQLNVVFKRRKIDNLINYFLPCNLDIDQGTSTKTITSTQRANALTFKTTTTPAESCKILKATINIKAMYLQVNDKNIFTNSGLNVTMLAGVSFALQRN